MVGGGSGAWGGTKRGKQNKWRGMFGVVSEKGVALAQNQREKGSIRSSRGEKNQGEGNLKKL